MTDIQTVDRLAVKTGRRYKSITSMPIFFYFAVMGSMLVALLFVADATLEKHEPLWSKSEFTGLPKAWHPEKQNLAANAAPDLISDAVKVVAPPEIAANSKPATPAVKSGSKKKAVARKELPGEAGQRYAWRPGDSHVLRGNPLPWRF